MSVAKQFRSVAGPAAPIRVVEVIRTCCGMPAQWDGTTDDGRKVYVRYRHSYGYVQVAADPGDQSEFAALHGPMVCEFERINEQRPGWDGDLTETELAAITAGYVTWPPMTDLQYDDEWTPIMPTKPFTAPPR